MYLAAYCSVRVTEYLMSKVETKEKVISIVCVFIGVCFLLYGVSELNQDALFSGEFLSFVGVFLCFIYLGLSPQLFYLPFKVALTGNINVLFISKLNHVRLGVAMFLCMLISTIMRVLL
jgi:hypothetical protein